MAVSRTASAPVELAPMRPPTMAVVLTFGLIVVTLAYPPLLYDEGLQRSLTSNGTLIFWAHTAVCAVGLLIAVALRATAFTSVQMFHWIFFVVAAREQFIHGWDGLYQLTDVVERGLLYVLLYEIVLLTVYLANVGGRRGAFAPVTASTRVLAGHVRLTLLLVACFALDLVLLAHYGSSLFLSRYHFSTHSAQLFPAQFNLIFLQFIRPLLFFLPLFVLRSQLSWSKPRPDPLPWWLIGFAALCAGLGYLFNTPFNSPRFHAGTIAIGTVMLFVGPRRMTVLLGAILAGTLMAPLFHAFRSEWTRENTNIGADDLGFSQLRHFDFDALTNHFYAVYFLEKQDYFYGLNILSGFLFFVPNEIWQAKIANSGAMILGSVGWEFRDEFPWNSSMPMVGEGLLAGGVAGVLVMAAGFAIFLRFLDRAPEPATPVVTGLHVRAAVLAFSPVLLFFLSRGQFVATMAYSTGTLLAVAAAAALISRRISAEADLSPPADAERRPAVARSRPIGARWAAGSTLGARASRRT